MHPTSNHLEIYINKKYVLWNAGICPIASKVGQVTLATPLFGVIHLDCILLPAVDLTEKTQSLWPKIEIQDGGRPPSWIFENLISEHWDPLGCRFSITV